jgi:hypothetical protein
MAARVRTVNFRSTPDTVVAVRFVTHDDGNKPLRTIAEFIPKLSGSYRDWIKPQKSVELADGEKSLRVEIELHHGVGIFEVDDILVVPTDPTKELDMEQIRTMFKAIDAGDTELVRKLVVEDKRYLECRDPRQDGGTPLIRTAWANKPEIAKLLLELGADRDTPDYNWKAPPVSWAAYLGRPELTKLLLDAGADPLQRNGGGATSLDTANFGLRSRKAGDATDDQRRETIEIVKEAIAARKAAGVKK